MNWTPDALTTLAGVLFLLAVVITPIFVVGYRNYVKRL